MASRTLHLAAAKVILENTPVPDENRFTLGILLPDMYDVERKARDNTHLLLYTGDGRKTIELQKFRDLFGVEMINDSLYLGYYLHLVQDLVYHYSLNEIYKFSSKTKGNVEKASQRLPADKQVRHRQIQAQKQRTPAGKF